MPTREVHFVQDHLVATVSEHYSAPVSTWYPRIPFTLTVLSRSIFSVVNRYIRQAEPGDYSPFIGSKALRLPLSSTTAISSTRRFRKP